MTGYGRLAAGAGKTAGKGYTTQEEAGMTHRKFFCCNDELPEEV